MAIPTATASASKPKRHSRHRHKHAWKDKHYRWVPDGDCGWRVQSYVVRHKHKPRRGHHRGPGPRPADRCAPAAAVNRDPRPPGAYQGPFGAAQAKRLLDRAGFGAVPGQAEQLATLGLVGAVQSLTRPSGSATLRGPAPVDDDNNPIAPADSYGHDHLWFLDRMVRSDQPLVERMALVFHDWFATSNASVSHQQQLIDQSNLFRSACFGSFLDLFKAVTVDPAMLQWLNGAENTKQAPNENYGREMMELFSLGADRGAYTEDDIREQARALTGWDYEWSNELGAHNFHFEPKRHDTGTKTVFGRALMIAHDPSSRWANSESCGVPSCGGFSRKAATRSRAASKDFSLVIIANGLHWRDHRTSSDDKGDGCAVGCDPRSEEVDVLGRLRRIWRGVAYPGADPLGHLAQGDGAERIADLDGDVFLQAAGDALDEARDGGDLLVQQIDDVELAHDGAALVGPGRVKQLA